MQHSQWWHLQLSCCHIPVFVLCCHLHRTQSGQPSSQNQIAGIYFLSCVLNIQCPELELPSCFPAISQKQLIRNFEDPYLLGSFPISSVNLRNPNLFEFRNSINPCSRRLFYRVCVNNLFFRRVFIQFRRHSIPSSINIMKVFTCILRINYITTMRTRFNYTLSSTVTKL